MFDTIRDQRLERWFSFVDVALAQHIVRAHPEVPVDTVCFLAYLSWATRQGHLCLSITPSSLTPHPSDIRREDSQGIILTTEEIQEMSASIMRGLHNLPEDLITPVETTSAHPATPLCRHGSRYYLQRFWIQETRLLESFTKLLHTPPALTIDPQAAKDYVETLLKENILLPNQAQALISGCTQSLTMICGGPGTGKTYTAAHLLALCWNMLTEQERSRFDIALAAPTGKAAANLQKSLSKVIDRLQNLNPVKARTLHTLLGVRSREPRILSADLIIVDECSMIDVDLMVALLQGIKPGARLIMLGDPHQLPSIEAGGIFKDLVEGMRHSPKHKPIELHTCLRTDNREVIQWAQAIRDGNLSTCLPDRELEPSGTNPLRVQQTLFDHVAHHFIYPPETTPQSLLTFFNRFRLLSPLRRGPYGVDALNDYFKMALMKMACHQEVFVAPIMVKKNATELDLFNGEVGVLVHHQTEHNTTSLHEGDYALFEGCSEGEVRKIPALLLPPFEFAYCLSVHKSQGSEFDHILLLLPEGAEIFGREVMYTAVTRAKKSLEVWASTPVVTNILSRSTHRLSGVTERLTAKG